jgi:iron(III) transport system ATP-binding protein
MMNAKRVKFENLTKIFVTDKNKQVKAVENVNLDINPGEFVCLLGPSGCGKTTTLRMLAGFEVPTEGKIFIGDENVERLTPDKRDTAMVFQNYALFPHMNVFDNISYGLRLQKLPKEEINARVKKILSLMKMEEFAERVPSQMSGGQQQRVSLARALIMEPGVLLFDEPLSNLDAKLRIHMRDEIRKIQQEVGITSIYVTHDQSEAMGLSDKIVIMKDGLIEQVGSPDEIYQRPINAFVANFIGRANIILATVEEVKESTLVIDVHGVKYETAKTKSYNLGDKVNIVVRPESIEFGKSDFEAKVTKSMFMGAHHEYEVNFFGQHLEISVNNPMNKTMVKINENLKFALDPNSIHIL